MAIGRGNQSKYAAKANERLKPLTEQSDEALELAWQKAIKRGPLISLYAEAKRVYLSKEAVRCKDFIRAIEVFAAVTGDVRFLAAAQAMKDHKLMDGYVKETLMATAKKHNCYGAEWAAMDAVHSWVGKKAGGKTISVARAAKLAAIEVGVPGASFAEVVKDLRKLYPEWKLAIQQEMSQQQLAKVSSE
jgi:hypothetical protein